MGIWACADTECRAADGPRASRGRIWCWCWPWQPFITIANARAACGGPCRGGGVFALRGGFRAGPPPVPPFLLRAVGLFPAIVFVFEQAAPPVGRSRIPVDASRR